MSAQLPHDGQRRSPRRTLVARVRAAQYNEGVDLPLAVFFNVFVSDECEESLNQAFPSGLTRYHLSACIASSAGTPAGLLHKTPEGEELHEVLFGEYKVTYAVCTDSCEAVAIIMELTPEDPRPRDPSPMKTLFLMLFKWGGLATLAFVASRMFPFAKLASGNKAVEGTRADSEGGDVDARGQESPAKRSHVKTRLKFRLADVGLDRIEVDEFGNVIKVTCLADAKEAAPLGGFGSVTSECLNDNFGFEETISQPPNNSVALVAMPHAKENPLEIIFGLDPGIISIVDYVLIRGALFRIEGEKQRAERSFDLLTPTKENYSLLLMIQGRVAASRRRLQPVVLHCDFWRNQSSHFLERIERVDYLREISVASFIKVLGRLRTRSVMHCGCSSAHEFSANSASLAKHRAVDVALMSRRHVTHLQHYFENSENALQTYCNNSNMPQRTRHGVRFLHALIKHLEKQCNSIAARWAHESSSVVQMVHHTTDVARVFFEPAVYKLCKTHTLLDSNFRSHQDSRANSWMSFMTCALLKRLGNAADTESIFDSIALAVEGAAPANKPKQLANYERLLRLARSEIDAHRSGKKLLSTYNVIVYRDTEFAIKSQAGRKARDSLRLH